MADKVASLVAEVSADTSKLENSLKESKGGLQGMVGSFTELSSALGLAEKGFGLVKEGINQTVGVTVAYAGEVRSLSQAFSISSQEASTLLNVADDLKISSGTLTTAFREMAKDGISPSLNSIKELAKQYQAIKDPAEKAQFALKNFGKAGLEMTPILLSTTDQIDAMAQSARDAGLVMSGEAVDAAREYEVAMDDLGDSAKGLQIQLGQALLPAVKGVTDFANDRLSTFNMLKQALDSGAISTAEYAQQMGSLLVLGPETATELAFVTEKLHAQQEEQDKLQMTTGATITAVMNLTTAEDALAESTGKLNEETSKVSPVYSEAEAAMARLNVGEATRLEIEKELAVLSGALTREDLARRDAIGFLTKQLAEGKITQEEYLESIKRLASGADTARQAIERVGDAINKLPSSKDIHININETFGGAAGEVGIGPTSTGVPVGPDIEVGGRRASGGPVQAGEDYLVGEDGPEIFRAPKDGVIIPNGQTTATGLFAGATIIVQNEMDIESLARRVTEYQRRG